MLYNWSIIIISVPGRDSIISQVESGKSMQAMFRSKSGTRTKGPDLKTKSASRTSQERKKYSASLVCSTSKSTLPKVSEISESEMSESTGLFLKSSNTSGELRGQSPVITSAQVASSTEQHSAKYKLGRRSSKIPKPSSLLKSQEK